MAGVSVDTGKSGRRAVDSEINMVPFIDLLIVSISFLLITAVWSHMGRINANARVPGPPQPEEERENVEPEQMLTVEMKQDDKFVLIWKSGATVHATTEVERKATTVEGAKNKVRYLGLAKEVTKQWKDRGSHKNDNDPKRDQAIISVDNRAPFADIVAVIDAIYSTRRSYKGEDINAFNVTFSAR